MNQLTTVPCCIALLAPWPLFSPLHLLPTLQPKRCFWNTSLSLGILPLPCLFFCHAVASITPSSPHPHHFILPGQFLTPSDLCRDVTSCAQASRSLPNTPASVPCPPQSSGCVTLCHHCWMLVCTPSGTLGQGEVPWSPPCLWELSSIQQRLWVRVREESGT